MHTGTSRLYSLITLGYYQKDLLSSQVNIKIIHLAVPKHDSLVITFNNSDHCFHLRDEYMTKVLRIDTQQCSSYINCQFVTVVSPQIQTLKGFRITINKNVASACFFRDNK